MIDELIDHSEQERRLTEQAKHEAQSIRDAADKLASQHYDAIIDDYQDQAGTYRDTKLDEAEQQLEEVRDEAEQTRKKLSKTRSKLDEHATTIVNQVKTVINDNA